MLTSEASAAAFGERPRKFAAWVRAHAETFETPAPGSCVKVAYETVDLVLLFARIDLQDGRLPLSVIAAVLPGEESLAERSVEDLRRHLSELAKNGRFTP